MAEILGLVADVLSWIFLVTGSLFCIVGGIGLLRMPDFYTRLHAAGITDTLGAGLVLLGLILQAGFSLITVKLLFILGFLYFTSPAVSHALAKAAYSWGIRWDESTRGDGDALSP